MNFVINHYRYKKFNETYFLTTDNGQNIVLNESEFLKLNNKDIDSSLFLKLEKNGIIVTEKNKNEILNKIRKRNHFLFNGTSLHIIVLTLRCNMKCVYCHASSRSEEEKEYDLNLKDAEKIVDFIFQSPNNSITIEFQGGEPLLNWDTLKHLVNYAYLKNTKAKKDLEISLVTNLEEMDKDKMNFLIDHSVNICTSLDGPKEVHDYNRKCSKRSNYEQVIKWIKEINNEYKNRKMNKKVGALVTLTRKSLEYPTEIIDEYVKLNINSVHLRFLSNLGVATQSWKHINYSPDEFIEFWERSMKHILKLKKNGVSIEERMFRIMETKLEKEYDPNYLDLRSPCGAVIGQLVYDFNGDIYSCDEGRMIGEDLFKLGNVKENEYKEIVTGNKACSIILSSINDQYICDECVYKPYCGICPVCNFQDQGSVIGKISQTERCKIFKKQFDYIVKEKFINQ